MRYFVGIFTFIIFLTLPASAAAENFFVNENFDGQDRNIIEADLELSRDKAHFYVEREYREGLPENEILRLRSIISDLAVEFDGKIYPKLREVFGKERNPGIDKDGKITILLHDMKGGVGGYVREGDGYERALEKDSNEREMIYLNIGEIMNSEFGPAYLAHEFQHLITFNQKTIILGLSEDQWLNEARSEYAPTLLGYNDTYSGSYLKKRVSEFLAHPSDALLDWRGHSIDHASASLFMHYLVSRYGPQILIQMMQVNSVGIESINSSLAVLGYKERFREVFSDWLIAVYVNSSTNGDEDRFRYKSQNLSFGNLHVLPSATFRIYDNNSDGSNFIIDNWSGQWYRFVPGAIGEETTLHIRISSDSPRDLIVPYIVSDFFGETNVKFLDLSKNSILSISEFGNVISSLVLVPILAMSGGENISTSSGFSLEAFINSPFVSRFAEGAIVQAEGDSNIYIVKNSPQIGEVFMRRIQTDDVFDFYGHLLRSDIIAIETELISNFTESSLIRKAGDYKVYEVDEFGNKKWLDMTASEFEEAGYSWDAVYEVNEAEFDWYQ